MHEANPNQGSAPSPASAPTASDLDAVLASYLKAFPDERQRIQPLLRHLSEHPDDLFSRGNSAGHVTTSAVITNDECTKILLIGHRLIGRWLQPGGHYEPGSSLVGSAAREGSEETGLTSLRRSRSALQGLPIDIDSHLIPDNPRKGEPEHWHHDLAYLFSASENDQLIPEMAAISAVRWWTLQDVASLSDRRLDRLVQKITRSDILTTDA